MSVEACHICACTGREGRFATSRCTQEATNCSPTTWRSSGQGQGKTSPLFRPIRNNGTGSLERSLSTDGIYKIIRGYAKKLGVEIGAHVLRATAATNALEHEADIAKVQEWLGHAKLSNHEHRSEQA
jgi:integrase